MVEAFHRKGKEMEALDDSMIVDLYLQRDEDAIKYTAEKYGSRLRALAYSVTKDRRIAEECENDMYLEAWNSIPPNEPRDYLYAFLARIIRHITLNCCRSDSRLKRSAYISELSEELAHACLIAYGGDDGESLDIREAVSHEESDIVHGCLSLIDEDHLTGMEEGHLVDHLAAYAACGTGDEDDLVAELVGDSIHINIYPVAREEVFDLHLMELVVLEVGILVEVLYLGHHLDLDIAGDEVVDELLTGAEVVGLPGADDEARDILHAHGVDEVFVVDEDGLTHEVLAFHLDVGGDEALDDIFLAHVIAYALGYGDASMACAIDEDAVGLLREAEGVEKSLDDDSLEPEEQGAYEEDIDEGLDADGHAEGVGEDGEDDVGDGDTYEVGKEDAGEVNEAGVAYDA